MKIARIYARSLEINAPLTLVGEARKWGTTVCVVTVETTSGVIGEGLTPLEGGMEKGHIVSGAINDVIGPTLLGEDILHTDRLFERMYWLCSPRWQAGLGFHAMSAIDIAVWDAKGKSLNQPIWKLIGGARQQIPVYGTFGLTIYDRDELVEAAKLWVEQGYTRLKMVVGDHALANRDTKRSLETVLAEDVKRVAAVREAVGDEVSLYIDANCSLDSYHAIQLARRCEPYGISWFEEPIKQNDISQMSELRRQVPIPVAVGQNEAMPYRFREFLSNGAADVIQPNVTRSGGYTQGVKIAAIADSFNTQFSNGGAWHLHNTHLLAGCSNGHMAECHHGTMSAYDTIFSGFERPRNGIYTMSDKPGLGFEINWDAAEQFVI